MKRSIAFVSLAAVLSIGALAHGAVGARGANCSDCPVDHCPFCPSSK